MQIINSHWSEELFFQKLAEQFQSRVRLGLCSCVEAAGGFTDRWESSAGATCVCPKELSPVGMNALESQEVSAAPGYF